jgi:hypothetical protein
MEHPVGLIDFSGYHLDFEELTGLKVDIVTKLSKYARHI